MSVRTDFLRAELEYEVTHFNQDPDATFCNYCWTPSIRVKVLQDTQGSCTAIYTCRACGFTEEAFTLWTGIPS